MDGHQFRIAHNRFGCKYVWLTVSVATGTRSVLARLLSYEHPYARFQRTNGDTFYQPISQIVNMTSAEVPA